jgi:hypothetical protein
MLLIRIIQGWFYYFFRNEKVESIAAKRIPICLKCPHSKFYSWEKEWKHKDLGHPKNPDDVYCSKCLSCPISKKVRSPKEKCPIKKW